MLDVKFSVDQLKVSNTDETCALIDSGSKALALKIANRSNKMICSPRQQADFEFEKVKKSLKESSLNFFLEETAFSAKIHLKKTFLQDFSFSSTNATPVLVQSNSATITAVNSPTAADHSNSFNSAPNILEKTVLDLNQKIVQLKEDNNEKDKTILNLQSTLAKVEEERNEVRKDRETKAGQLKQKNKVIDTMKINLEKLKEEHENLKTSHQIRNKKLDKKIEILSSELSEKREEVKLEKRKERNDLKKINKESEKMKNEIKCLRKALEEKKAELYMKSKENAVTTKLEQYSENEKKKDDSPEEKNDSVEKKDDMQEKESDSEKYMDNFDTASDLDQKKDDLLKEEDDTDKEPEQDEYSNEEVMRSLEEASNPILDMKRLQEKMHMMFKLFTTNILSNSNLFKKFLHR